jgi:hypothetical protein
MTGLALDRLFDKSLSCLGCKSFLGKAMEICVVPKENIEFLVKT